MSKQPIKILSIDFDYIMAPCINLYNHMANGGENATVNWTNIQEELNIESHLHYDANYLKKIVQLILQGKVNHSIFVSITDHQEIVNYLKQLKDYDISTFDVTNVDFHHDMIYNDNIQLMVDFDECNCSNWMGYLYLKDKIHHGEWIKAPNSHVPNQDLIVKCFSQDIDYDIKPSYELDNLLDESFDYIFLCKSPQWVPYQFMHLFDICEMIGELKL